MADIPTLDPGATPVKRMRLRYAGTCAHCGSSLAKGEEAFYDREAKVVYCIECPGTAETYLPRFAFDPRPQADPEPEPTPASPETPPEPESYVEGIPGASARAQQQRRLAFVRERHPLIADALADTYGDHIAQAWETGAAGEEQFGQQLNQLAGPLLRVIHDRRVPTTLVNIDHIAVTPRGVWVIDDKRYVGGRPEAHSDLLYVSGKDRTKFVQSLEKQVQIVRAALSEHPEVPVHGCLCFLDADWTGRNGFTLGEIAVLRPETTITRLTEPGSLNEPGIAVIHRLLAGVLPARRED